MTVKTVFEAQIKVPPSAFVSNSMQEILVQVERSEAVALAEALEGLARDLRKGAR